MNSAKRIEKLLSKIKASKKSEALRIFEDVFEVKGCVRVCQKLLMRHKEIDKLKAKSHEDMIKYLEDIFSCHNLSRKLLSQTNMIDAYIMALSTVANFMEDEKVF